MQTRMKNALPIISVAISLAMGTSAYAKAILGIVPTSTTLRTINLASTSSTTLGYTVTNNTKISMSQLIIDPYYNTTGSLSLTVQNNHCTGTLASAASCTFELLIKGNGQSTTSTVMPRVCEFNSATCSVPILNNRITLTIGGTGFSIAYVINANANTVSICSVNATDGSFGTCNTSDGDGTFNFPYDISFNTNATAAFIANSGNNTVSICDIDQDGTGNFSNCTTTNGNGTFDYPVGITLNPTNTYLYVANNNPNPPTISICPVIYGTSGYSIGTCTTTTGNNSFQGPSGLQAVRFNPDGTYLYAPAGTWVSICPALNNGTGGIGPCTQATDSTFVRPQGITFNQGGTYAYIGNFYNSPHVHTGSVSICPVLQNGSGAFGSCISNNGNGTFDFFYNTEVDLWINPTNYGYVPNNGNNTVSICSIDTTTSNFDLCTTTSGNGTFNQPSSVVLSYVIQK